LRPLVVVADTMDLSGDVERRLAAAGAEVVVGRPLWEPGALPESELIELVRDADAAIGGAREQFTRRVLEACPRLRCVIKYGIGTDRIDEAAATELGIVVANTPISEAVRSVAEHTVAMILALVRRLQPNGRRAREGGWRGAGPAGASDDLRGKTVGIVGLGRIGRDVCRLLAPFEVTLVAADPYQDASWAREVGATLVPLDEVLERSDVVTLHVPASPETVGLIDATALARMKPDAYLVNTSRGVAIDTPALIEALQAGRIAGAALDVVDPEPPGATSPLLELDSLLITTHIASWTPPAGHAQMMAAVDAVLAVLRDEAPDYVVNPEVLPHRRGLGESLL
jgi:D-3-phosphoglycerate dehydrogenase